MKILTPDQIRSLEQATFKHPTHPVPYIDLMEEAGTAFTDIFTLDHTNTQHIVIFCGSGNNGGDGLVAARLLSQEEYQVTVVQVKIGQATAGYQANFAKLPSHTKLSVHTIEKGDDMGLLFGQLFTVGQETVIIDAIFGLGINRPVKDYWAQLINRINAQNKEIVAVDMPSGLLADTPADGAVIEATSTITFHSPKLSFFFRETEKYIGNWEIAYIPLAEDVQETLTSHNYVISDSLLPIIPQRLRFSHKGTYGNTLIIGGQYGMAGAALLSTQAALRSGSGKVTVLTPSCNQTILQLGAPEALLLPTNSDRHLAPMTIFTGIYSAIGIGPGLGKHADTVAFLRKLLRNNGSFVLDADAINILSENPDILDNLPPNTILTPHPKEFERIAGLWTNGFERLAKQKALSQKLGAYIIFKNASTCITTPAGEAYFNVLGNPGMAKGGTGDILTGYLTGLLARGISPLDACLLAVFAHAQAGDNAANVRGMESMKAGDLLEWL